MSTRRRPLPRAHWLLWLLVGVLVGMGLLLAGYADHEIGSPSTDTASGARAFRRGTGPIVELDGDEVRSVGAPARTVALTFDDGPDPTWTPKILDVLREHDARATFFVLGARAAAHPELVERMRAEGHEIGSHTFSHADLASLSGWERNLQLSLTQAALAGTVEIHTNLFRPPYSSTPDGTTRRELEAYRQVADEGYLIVLSDRDSRDWERPGVARIVAAATPAGTDGAVVLMHDGGGDRTQTVAALDRLLTELEARDYRFATVSDLTARDQKPIGRRTGDVQVGAGVRIQGRAIVTLQRWSSFGARLLQWALIPVGLLALLRGATVVVLARRHRRQRAVTADDRTRLGTPAPTKASVVIPAFNEAANIERTVRSIAESADVEVEVIVVDDGSTDATGAIVESLGISNVRVKRQRNGGKPRALNTGIAAATHDIVVMVDGDTVFEPHTVRNLLVPFTDPSVGAVSGNTKVGNRKGILGRWQHIEYVMGFNLDRRMYEQLDCMPTVPGAIGAFRQAALEAVGRVSDDTLAEDTDLTMAVNRAGWRVVYEETAIAWTEAPATLRGLWRQRYRWSYGTMQAMWKHRDAVSDQTHQGIGRRALPFLFLFQVLLPLLAPAIDVYALYGIAFLDPLPVLAAWIGFSAVQVGIAWFAFRLDDEPAGPLWAFPLQQFVYRQLMELVVIQSVVTAVLGARLPWQRSERRGSAADALAETAL